MDPYASGLHNLEILKDAHPSPTNSNEATTRLRLIDRLILDCLGWNPEDLVLEEHHDGEYVDYAIGTRAKSLIVEAKKEGIHFTLPPGVAGRRQVEIETLLTTTDTSKAIQQVLGYCQKRGVPIAVLANGHQLIAFFASRQDGVPPLKGRALIFSSIQEMCEDFSILWSHLSKEGIATRNLQRALLGKNPIALSPEKLSDRIPGYPGFRPRTQLETDLKIIGGLFIQDLEDEEEVEDQFLEECYCSSGALSQYALVSKEILRARYASVKREHPGQVESAYTKKGVNPALTTHAMSQALSRRPIVILGDVGVGKTIFLRHLIRIDAKDILAGSLVLYVDFGREPALASNLEDFVAKRLSDQLRDTYNINIRERNFVRAVYNRDINQFKQEPAGYLEEDDPAEFRRRELAMLEARVNDGPAHLRRSLEHIRGTSKRSPLVILDNIDQRPKDFQERVFLIGQSLAETWPGTVFISLRPSTFFESRSSGSLAAYQPRMFTIAPARTEQVILKRLIFARAKVEEAREGDVFPHGLSIDSSDLSAYMDVLIKAFESNDDLKVLIDNLSGGNLRTALMFLYAFIGSGYVSTQRVLEVAERGGLYSVPMHEFLRAIIFGDHEHFQPSASAICNLFDISENDGREHFLLPNILAHVQRLGESAGRDGFVPIDEVYDFTQGLGFSQEQTGNQLQRGLAKRLLESSSGESASAPCRVTTNGSYTYRSLVQRFVYIDAMIVDTPIVDAGFRRRIQDATSIFDRLDRACIFKEYLDSEWARFEAGATDLSFRWDLTSEALDRDLSDARYRAERARSKRESHE
ncbi:hypothetical protein [Actinomadura livida]|uniref:Guanylate kinase-like domain-containing protein n=1 Tax=Actinomadura livida TaxID=79909 RepID=A0A7W7MZB7_9ACTN|nr:MULTISPECIES: hypothetical protein [Actinomadura]MBB4776811.1 hypothetical protein [Actinomadura catellatispora]GGT95027.1 hypothetical protein GCM10010208_17810 [Actinomadura livida]